MRNLVQHILDSIAVWGPSALVLLGAVSLWGLARVYRRNALLPAARLWWRVGRSGWSVLLLVSGMAFYVMKVPMAPMTRSLASLSAAQGERWPQVMFRSRAASTPRSLWIVLESLPSDHG